MKVTIGQMNALNSMMVWSLLDKEAHACKVDVVVVQKPPVQVWRDTGKWRGYDILYRKGSLPLVALAM